MPEFSAICILFNPNSTGPSEDLANELAEELRPHLADMKIELVPTEHAGHATKLAYDFAMHHERPLIISSSGDGGYNEVVNGALQAQQEGAHPTCAVLAAGNANDHSTTILDRPLLDAIISGDARTIDVLEAEIHSGSEQRVRFAHSYIGIGLTPTVAVELNRNHLTRLKETFIAYKTLRDLQPVEIDVAGRRVVVDSLILANINHMAKVLTIASNASPVDGQLEITMFPYRRRIRLLLLLLKAMVVGVKGYHAADYKFTAVKDMVIQLDGEVVQLQAGDSVHVQARHQMLSTVR